MRTRDFLGHLRHGDIVDAIRKAELETSGEIRVFVSRKNVSDPVAEAQAAFVQMGMQQTSQRNGVLIFVAPRTHKFAVIGDLGIHERCGDEFWQELIAEVTPHFAEAHFSRGLIHAIRKTGAALAKHFPPEPGDRNELPNDVATD